MTGPSLFIQTHEGWTIPTLQTIHILGIGVVIASALMMALRILGWGSADQSLRQTWARFGPWLVGGLCVLLATGLCMIIGEPRRELLTVSFWVKMALLAMVTLTTLAFHIDFQRRELKWEQALIHRASIKWAAAGSFIILLCIIVLGRLIAYDHVWELL